jgi:nicotinate-nucleotide adenylyltransferase
MKKIALLGGSFNPVHYGHLSLAESARTKFSLDKIVFVPVGKQPHKLNSYLAPGRDRVTMIKLAIGTSKHCDIDDYEISSGLSNYTYKTIEHFKKIYDKDKLHFIVGIDILLDINKWEKGAGILDLCDFLVGMRPNFPVDKIPENLIRKVYLFKTPLLDISSTFIRGQIKSGNSVKYLTPDTVEQYILRNKLYK